MGHKGRTIMTDNPAQYLKGIPFEKYVCRFFELSGLGSQLDHNNFDPAFYPNDNHNIVDLVVKGKALIECTNPKETTFMNDSIMLNKLDYFKRADPKHLLSWILIISFAMFSDIIKQLIDKLGITLIVLNYHADTTNRTAFIRHLFKSKLYAIVRRLKPKVKKSGSAIQYSITTLSQYSYSVSVAKKVLDYTKNNYLHQHRDTKTEDTYTDNNRRFPDRRRFLNEPRFNH